MKRSENDSLFYACFVVCLLLVAVPVKNFAYLVPPVYVALRMCQRNDLFPFRLALLVGLVAVSSSLALLADALRGQNVNVPGMLVALLTYLPILILLAERFQARVDSALIERMTTLCAWFVIVQSLVGMVQFLISRNPDAVCGTFGLFDFRQGGITISQVYFTFTIFGMLLFLLLSPYRPLNLTALVSGLLICALAQSGHQTIFFVASVGLLGLSRIFRPQLALMSLGVACIVVFALLSLYPETIDLTVDWYEKVAQDADSPKRMAVEGGAEIVADAKNMLLGTGIGQFCSRAALITSGSYLSVPLPTFLTSQSDYYASTIVPADLVYAQIGEGSAVSKPYASLLSLVVELGLVQFGILSAIAAVAMFRNFQLMRSRHSRVARIGFVANVGIVFFVLCCTIENYAEFPQAVFVPLLLYTAVQSHARTILSEDRDSAKPNSGHTANRSFAHKLPSAQATPFSDDADPTPRPR